jgi:rhamnose utilization protein RhaD (predicted bifunctional aldolase and dehydrogenase)
MWEAVRRIQGPKIEEYASKLVKDFKLDGIEQKKIEKAFHDAYMKELIEIAEALGRSEAQKQADQLLHQVLDPSNPQGEIDEAISAFVNNDW